MLTAQWGKEREQRKKLQNELIELRGNIRVFCRIRPAKSGDSCMEVGGEESTELVVIFGGGLFFKKRGWVI